jgi:S1-C subfamily serine protease
LNKDRNGDKASAVESYIQTDAAVNMGNSGGALINTDGRLIGVNSAIASPTGYYSGYSYAIPVNIVKKVVDDLIKFGTVQRGYLGINYIPASDYSDDEKKRAGVPLTAEGIYVTDVPTDGGAYAAGMRKGDVIKKMGGVELSNGAEMQEQISRYKPGDKVAITYERNGTTNTVDVTLKNKIGNFDVVKTDAIMEAIGADLATLDAKKAKDYGVSGGVVVKKINKGAFNDQTRMKDGFVILKVNDANVKSVDEFKAAIGTNKNITISGFYPGYDGIYDYPISLDDDGQ